MVSVSPVVIDSSSAAAIVNIRGYNFDKLDEMGVTYQVKENGEVVAEEFLTCQMLSAETASGDFGGVPAQGIALEIKEVYGILLESYDRVTLWQSN